jgi:outer membrane receptor protein involved in Fe transport
LSSDQIKSIEVITTPPAKYAADGSSALINIKLKKTPIDAWAVTLRANYIQASYPTFAEGIGFNFNKKRVTIVADFVKQEGSIKTLETVDTEYATEKWESRTNRRDYTDVYRGIFGIDYKLTDKANIGFKYTGIYNKPDIDDYNNTSVFDKNTNQLKTLIKTDGYNNSKTDNNSLNLYYIQKLDTIGKQMTVDFDAFNYQDSQNRTFNSNETDVATNVVSNFFNANNIGLQDLTNFSGKIDFEISTKWANYSFGGKLSWIDNTSDIQFFKIINDLPIVDPNQTNVFHYSENTQAVYFSANKSLGEKWQAQVGLRYETTQTKGKTEYIDNTQEETNKFDYDQLFPTAYLMYTPNENNNFSISYSKRVGRPDYWALNPYKWYLSPYEIAQGNPYLQPSFTDNLELSFKHKENWTFKLYYSNTTNGNAQIPFVDLNENPPITFYIRDNFYDLQTYGGSISYYFAKFTWWESSNSLNGYYNQTQFIKEIPAEEEDGFSYAFGTYNTFTLNKKQSLFGEINFNYNAPVYSLFNEITSYHRLDVGFRYTLRDKGWNFIIYGSDLTRASLNYTLSEINNTLQKRSIYFDERSVRIGVTYKFGNKKLRANSRESSNEEEKNRIR